MARAVFYSFHYKPDNWRASKVRQMGALEGNQLLSDNDWEDVTSGGEQAIENWIAEQMRGKSCEVVLIGASTAGRKWVKYEIEKAWDDRARGSLACTFITCLTQAVAVQARVPIPLAELRAKVGISRRLSRHTIHPT